MKTVAIIRARMTSSRLPGKPLIDIAGKPMIWHIIKRLSQAKKLDEIVMATSKERADTPLVNYVRKLGYRVYRYDGDINNVTGRLLAAAKWVKADLIVGICGDSPLVDPNFVDQVVSGVVKKKADSAKLKEGQECQHEGLDICTMTALQKQVDFGKKPHHKEHLNIYLKEHPEKFKWHEVTLAPPFNKHLLRISVDTPSDLNFMREIYRLLWDKKNIIEMNKVISLYKSNKQLQQINADVKQKSKNDVSRKFIIRTDALPAIGFGHLSRMMALAKILQDNFFCGILFVIRKNKIAERKLSEQGFKYVTITLENQFYKLIRNDSSFDTIIVDTLSKIQTRSVRLPEKKIIIIDRFDKLAQEADLCILPNAHNAVKEHKKMVGGFKYVVIRDEIKKLKRKFGKYVLLSFGGSDPKNITVKVLNFFSQMNFSRSLGIYLGPFNNRRRQVNKLTKKFGKKIFVFSPGDDFGKALAQSCFAVIGFGQTIYEALYLKVPTLAIAHHPEKISSKEFKRLNFVKYIGEIDKLKLSDFSYWFNKFDHEHAALQKEMNQRNIVDEKGLNRLAEKIYHVHD